MNEKIDEIQTLYNSGLSMRKILCKGFKKRDILIALKNKSRNMHDANALAHKLYPDSFKHTEKTKLLLRKKQLKFYKDNPQAATSWRQKSLSYPEKLFLQLIKKNDLAKKYDIVREYSFFPYFIDFAFVNIKLAVEIDGSQHWKVQSKIERDKKKETLFLNGWKIYRIPEFLIKSEFEKVEQDFLSYLQTFNEQCKLFTFEQKIIEHEEFKKYKEQQHQQKRHELKNKRQQLKQQWLSNRLNDVKQIGRRHWGYICQLSKLWNVSHSQVRRFLKKYGGVA